MLRSIENFFETIQQIVCSDFQNRLGSIKLLQPIIASQKNKPTHRNVVTTDHSIPENPTHCMIATSCMSFSQDDPIMSLIPTFGSSVNDST